ncbi:nucleotide-binding domain containing protein, partial [Escherichia coli]|uniref:nucleotide-binding domain containing protein n=1 Tax=Escherichia coli TaxID=562 RepID=UPI0032E50765
GTAYAVVDAVTPADLTSIGRAVLHHRFVSGAAGLAGGLAAATAERKALSNTPAVSLDPVPEGPSIALAGSCSARTLQQIHAMQAGGHPSYRLDAVAVPDSELLAEAALAWYDAQQDVLPPIIYSSLAPDELRESQ